VLVDRYGGEAVRFTGEEVLGFPPDAFGGCDGKQFSKLEKALREKTNDHV
jgi:hypothetical protein